VIYIKQPIEGYDARTADNRLMRTRDRPVSSVAIRSVLRIPPSLFRDGSIGVPQKTPAQQ
jgi:hypothetical protein